MTHQFVPASSAVDAVADVIGASRLLGPSFSKAVSYHFAQQTHPGCGCTDCLHAALECVAAIIAELNAVQDGAAMLGMGVMILPVTQEEQHDCDALSESMMGEMHIVNGVFQKKLD